ncbi:MAG TPA: nuclear transport factor 2 family protein [Bryobacteraceae bacterium]|nr:nuclear transport factor 2 family protein [Bryobacteraceae bacterium]
MNRRLLLILVPALLLAAGPEDAIKQAEKDWAGAVVTKDYAVLDRVLSDDLAYTHSDGRLDSKSEFIEALRSGKQAYNAAEHESIDVRLISKDVALVRARLKMTAAVAGQSATPANFSVLRVYKLLNGKWQLVGHQSARLAK